MKTHYAHTAKQIAEQLYNLRRSANYDTLSSLRVERLFVRQFMVLAENNYRRFFVDVADGRIVIPREGDAPETNQLEFRIIPHTNTNIRLLQVRGNQAQGSRITIDDTEVTESVILESLAPKWNLEIVNYLEARQQRFNALSLMERAYDARITHFLSFSRQLSSYLSERQQGRNPQFPFTEEKIAEALEDIRNFRTRLVEALNKVMPAENRNYHDLLIEITQIFSEYCNNDAENRGLIRRLCEQLPAQLIALRTIADENSALTLSRIASHILLNRLEQFSLGNRVAQLQFSGRLPHPMVGAEQQFFSRAHDDIIRNKPGTWALRVLLEQLNAGYQYCAEMLRNTYLIEQIYDQISRISFNSTAYPRIAQSLETVFGPVITEINNYLAHVTQQSEHEQALAQNLSETQPWRTELRQLETTSRQNMTTNQQKLNWLEQYYNFMTQWQTGNRLRQAQERRNELQIAFREGGRMHPGTLAAHLIPNDEPLLALALMGRFETLVRQAEADVESCSVTIRRLLTIENEFVALTTQARLVEQNLVAAGVNVRAIMQRRGVNMPHHAAHSSASELRSAARDDLANRGDVRSSSSSGSDSDADPALDADSDPETPWVAGYTRRRPNT